MEQELRFETGLEIADNAYNLGMDLINCGEIKRGIQLLKKASEIYSKAGDNEASYLCKVARQISQSGANQIPIN